MNTILEYNFVSVAIDNGVLIVGFADAQFDTQSYLVFQRSLDENESDEDVYVERDEQGQSNYGGIEKFILLRDKAIMKLNLETSEWLAVEQEVTIKFSVSDEIFKELLSGFDRLFFGKEILEIK